MCIELNRRKHSGIRKEHQSKFMFPTFTVLPLRVLNSNSAALESIQSRLVRSFSREILNLRLISLYSFVKLLIFLEEKLLI
jgi:hypothetical protein